MESLLEGTRVLDLTDEKGLLCGRMLGDLGADVIKIEPPGGDCARRLGPFYGDEPDPERSLNWFAYNLNKRGITLDIGTADGKALLRELVRKADAVIESFPRGFLDGMGLGYSALSSIKPGLVMASVSPFGQAGPYRDYVATDIVGVAMGGYLYLCGVPEREPVRISFPQAYLHAAAEAAAGIMIALYHRDLTGEGQYVDASMQQSMVMNTVQAIPFWLLSHTVLERSGPFRVGLTSGTRQRQTWRCKDGTVNFVIYGGRSGATRNAALQSWMIEENAASDHLKGIDFYNWDVFDITQDGWEAIETPITRFFLTKTKQELFTQGAKRKVPIVPVSSPGEVVDAVQTQCREFWVEVEHPELGTTIKYPGFCARFSDTPCRVLRRAPLIGEHNMEIYRDELGLSAAEIDVLARAVVI